MTSKAWKKKFKLLGYWIFNSNGVSVEDGSIIVKTNWFISPRIHFNFLSFNLLLAKSLRYFVGNIF